MIIQSRSPTHATPALTEQQILDAIRQIILFEPFHVAKDKARDALNLLNNLGIIAGYGVAAHYSKGALNKIQITIHLTNSSKPVSLEIS